MTWLDDLAGVKTVSYDGSPVTVRSKLNFVGDGVSVADNTGDEQTDVTILTGGTSVYVTDLTALVGTVDRARVYCDGHTSRWDGGAGTFVWHAGSSTTANGGTVLGAGTGRWKRVIETDHYNARWFGVTGNGTTDDGPLLDVAWTAAMTDGKPLYVPAGTYRIATSVTVRPISFSITTNTFAPGPKMYGDGIGNTIFVLDFSGVMFDIISQEDPVVSYRGFLGCELEKFSVYQNNTFANTTAIKLRTVYLTRLSQIHIKGLVKMANGIWIPTNYGDNDGSNQIIMEHIRIENCTAWGIKADADFATNETSYITMTDVFLQENGTVSASTPPPSGGMIWKGQSLTMRDCCFEINNNVGLYIRGESGLASNATFINTTWESNKRRGLYCTGITCLVGQNIQFYNNDDFIATVACEFDGSTAVVRNIDINTVIVRATEGNGDPDPYTAFKISGTFAEVDTCRVRNVEWNDFDFAGQTRFDGWKFDPVPHQCYLVYVNDQIVRLTPAAPGRGNSMPLRMAGPSTGTVPSTTGEWVVTSIDTNGEAITPTTGSGPEVPATLLEGGSIAASTRYHVYLWDDDGNRKMSLSATAPTVDSEVGSNSGYWVRTGDVAKLWIGTVTTTSAAAPNIRFSHVENGGEGLIGSAVYDPGNLVDGDGATTTVPVIGAALGDYARASFSLNLQGITLTAWVSAADTVSVRLQNETGGAIDLAPGILRARVERA